MFCLYGAVPVKQDTNEAKEVKLMRNCSADTPCKV